MRGIGFSISGCASGNVRITGSPLGVFTLQSPLMVYQVFACFCFLLLACPRSCLPSAFCPAFCFQLFVVTFLVLPSGFRQPLVLGGLRLESDLAMSMTRGLRREPVHTANYECPWHHCNSFQIQGLEAYKKHGSPDRSMGP